MVKTPDIVLGQRWSEGNVQGLASHSLKKPEVPQTLNLSMS